MIRIGSFALLGLALLVAPHAGLAPAAAAPTPASDVYVPGSRDIPQTVERALADGALTGVGAVVFAFEAASFSPPGGRTEFTAFYGFHGDVDKWVAALGAAAAKSSVKVYGMTSMERELVPLDRPMGPQALKSALTARWSG